MKKISTTVIMMLFSIVSYSQIFPDSLQKKIQEYLVAKHQLDTNVFRFGKPSDYILIANIMGCKTKASKYGIYRFGMASAHAYTYLCVYTQNNFIIINSQSLDSILDNILIYIKTSPCKFTNDEITNSLQQIINIYRYDINPPWKEETRRKINGKQ